MKRTLGVSVALLLSTPFVATALTIHLENGVPLSDVDELISGISSINIATSSSGGMVAPGGAAVSGDADASAYVRTIMNSGTKGTVTKTEIRTESNGVVHVERQEKITAGNGKGEIHIVADEEKPAGGIQVLSDLDGLGQRSGFSALLNGIFAPASPSVEEPKEEKQFESIFEKHKSTFFSSLWLRAWTFLGFSD